MAFGWRGGRAGGWIVRGREVLLLVKKGGWGNYEKKGGETDEYF